MSAFAVEIRAKADMPFALPVFAYAPKRIWATARKRRHDRLRSRELRAEPGASGQHRQFRRQSVEECLQ